MRVVVTGGAGFIGSAFINFLKENFHCNILCVDSLTYCSNLDNIKISLIDLQNDVRNQFIAIEKYMQEKLDADKKLYE